MNCTTQIEKLRNRKGIGLLELMLALAIIAILIIMATRYYQSASTSQKIADAQGQITAIMTAATSWAKGFAPPSYTGVSMTAISGGLPKTLAGTGANASPWGTNISVAAGTPASTTFTITFTGIPGYSCDAIKAKYPAATSSITVTGNGATGTSTAADCVLTYVES